MNPNHQRETEFDDPRFDRLADGEMSPDERRELLGGLDDEPGGWRRCALAFLEAQAWKHELRAIAREPVAATAISTPPATPAATTWRGWSGGRHATAMAMAASFLVALLLGIVVRDAWRPGPNAGSPAWLVERAADVGGPTGVGAPGDRTPADRTADARQLPTDTPRGSAPDPTRDDSPSSPVRWVTLTSTGGPQGETESIRLPAVERDRIDQQWLDSIPAAIPDDVVGALRRMGHRVDFDRRLVPLPLPNGSQLVLPVDEFDIDYVSRPPL